MKFSNYLKAIDDVSIYPMISLFLFMTVFVCVVVYMFRMNKAQLDERANIPLK